MNQQLSPRTLTFPATECTHCAPSISALFAEMGGNPIALFSRRINRSLCVLFAVLLFTTIARPQSPSRCNQVVLNGQVTAGHEWRQPIGQGWVLRLVPVPSAYSGWDLVLDRDPAAGFPDAILLATPPYNSISEREIATTFGLRAQDVLGWNPRTFRFLTDPAAFEQARRVFLALGPLPQQGSPTSAQGAALQQLMALNQHSYPGQFRILDARIVSGVADPAPFAQKWALQSSRTPHTIDSSSTPTPRGAIQSLTFSIALWLPAHWHAPAQLHPTPAPCSQ